MSKILTSIKTKLGFLGAIILAAFVGGVSSAAVLAAIPNSTTGQIEGCYRKSGGSKGSLRVIDTQNSDSCTGNESAISWDQSGWRAYGYITPDGTLETTRSKNITSVSQVIVDGVPQDGQYCVVTPFSPALISLTSDLGFNAGPIQGTVRGANSSGDASLDNTCGLTASVYIINASSGAGTYVFIR
jgi:hypothetical protein